MELNREQTRQALECCTHTPRPDCNNCPMGEKRGCVIALIEFALKHYTELTKENEWLRGVKEEYETFIGGMKAKIDTVKAEIKADTVKKMQERLKGRNTVYCINESDLKVMNFVVDQIAKEILEGANNDG